MSYKNNVCFKHVLLLLAISLPGCDNTAPVISDGTLSTLTPASMRAIPVKQLRADVMLSGTTTSYFGTNFPNGEWIIDLKNVEANRRYTLLISWYLGEHLLMEESGSITTDAANPVIRPDLDFATSGPDRFDTDCDGLPNIFEINQGSDPGTSRPESCRTPPSINDPGTLELAWLSRNFNGYPGSGVEGRTTKVEQGVVIRDSASEQKQFYSLIALSEDGILQPDGSEATARATVQLVYDPAGSDSLRFFTRQAISAVPAIGNGSACESNESGYFCSVPASLSAGTLYTLALTEVSPFQWQATVTDDASGTTIIGTMETPSQTSWIRHAVDLGFNQMLTREACSQGLDKISVRFTDATVNDTAIISPGAINSSECVQLGLTTNDTAWTGGEKQMDGTTWYSLTIGN